MRLRLIGYWNGGYDQENEKWPDPKDFISDFSLVDRQKILSYFETGVRMPYEAGGLSECRFCGKGIGSGELTDGHYLWPEGLPHYIAEHSLKLPEEFLKLINYDNKIDSNLYIDIEALEIDTLWWENQKIN